jgi:ABC-2 type transport system ATP-binding protein
MATLYCASVTFRAEPYAGLDAVARQLLYDRLLVDYVQHPRTILISIQLIDEVAELLEHVGMIDRERIMLHACPVARAYVEMRMANA